MAGKTVRIDIIAASDPKVKAAVVATDQAGATKAAGKAGAFFGTVANIYASKGNRVTKLNFDLDYKKAMTAVVFASSYSKLPDLKILTLFDPEHGLGRLIDKNVELGVIARNGADQ